MAREIHVSAVLMCDESGRVLHVRKRGTSVFMLPGGKPEANELPHNTAMREFQEELGATLSEELLLDHGTFRADAANEADHTVVAQVFSHPFISEVTADAEIDEIAWIHPTDTRYNIAPLNTELLFPALISAEIIPLPSNIPHTE